MRIPAARHFGLVLAASLLLTGLVEEAGAEPVYRYETEDGRPAFTNVRSLAPAGAPVREVELPELSQLDFAQATEAELARIDARLERAHAQLTTGEACRQAARDGEMPWYARIYRRQPHWVWLAGVFVAMALMGRAMSGWLPSGTWMRTMLFVTPLLVAVGILGSLAANMSETLVAVRREASACNRDLAPARPGDAEATRRRAGIVAQIQQVLSQRAERLERETERLGPHQTAGRPSR